MTTTTTPIRCVCAAALERTQALYGHLDGRIVWLAHPRGTYGGTLRIPSDRPGYLYLDRGDVLRDKIWHHEDVTAVHRAVWRIHHPADVYGDIIHTHNPTNDYLLQAHHRGLVVSESPDTELSRELSGLLEDAVHLVQAAHTANRPWHLELRERVEGRPTVVVLQVQGLAPDRPEEWAIWEWVHGALTRGQVPVHQAEALLST